MKLTSKITETNRVFPSKLELPFWLTLMYWGLMPATRNPWFEIQSVPISFNDILNIAVALFYLLLPAIYKHPLSSIRKAWHYHLPSLTLILILYAAISTEWSNIHPSDYKPMLYTLILAASAFLLGYNIISKRSPESVRQFLWQLTVYVAALGLIYSAASFLSLGLGGDTDNIASDFGVKRVKGPLFGSSTGYFILLPALGFSMQEVLKSSGQKRLFKIAVLFSLVLTLFGLGSRAGLLLFFLFFILVVLFMKNRKQAAISVALMFIVALAAGGLFFSRAKTDRLQTLEDTSRSDTYQTSFTIIDRRDNNINILGSGYASYWPWYIPDVQDARKIGQYYNLVWNPYGNLLYHPHSTFLLFILELGLPGLIYFLFLWVIFFILLLSNISNGEFHIFNCSIFASGISMFFDFFIFKSPQVNTIWWIFLCGALALNLCNSQSRIKNNKDPTLE